MPELLGDDDTSNFDDIAEPDGVEEFFPTPKVSVQPLMQLVLGGMDILNLMLIFKIKKKKIGIQCFPKGCESFLHIFGLKFSLELFF